MLRAVILVLLSQASATECTFSSEEEARLYALFEAGGVTFTKRLEKEAAMQLVCQTGAAGGVLGGLAGLFGGAYLGQVLGRGVGHLLGLSDNTTESLGAAASAVGALLGAAVGARAGEAFTLQAILRLGDGALMSREDAVRDCRALLGLPLSGTLSRDAVLKAYRTASLRAHPDKGGSAEAQIRVNVCRIALLAAGGHSPESHARDSAEL
jgi:hypothetical protein